MPERIELDQFIPPHFREEGTNLLNKLVSLYEDVINGDFSTDPTLNFNQQLEDIFSYWDILRKDEILKVREVLEPTGLSDILALDINNLRRFLFYCTDIYAVKGTLKSLRYIMKLLGMDIDIIQWYEPEYLDFRPAVENCRMVVKTKIGNNPLTDETERLLIKVITLMLDICTIVEVFIFIKNLTDKVDMTDTINEIRIRHCQTDVYSKCCFDFVVIFGDCKSDPTAARKRLFPEESLTRYLDPDEANLYQCTLPNCFDIYDPLFGDPDWPTEKRVPFSELPANWKSSFGASKTDFTPVYFNPTRGHAEILYFLHLINNQPAILDLIAFNTANDPNYNSSFTEFGDFLDALEAFNAALTPFISTLNNLPYYSYFYDKVAEDNYRFYRYAGANVNPMIIDLYSRGMVGAPVLCRHGDPEEDKYFYDHNNFGPNCTINHTGMIRFQEYKGVVKNTTCVDIHIQDPYLRHGTDLTDAPPHDGSYCHNHLFDLGYDPKRVCFENLNFNFFKHGQNGIYPYPRHGMSIVLDDCQIGLGYVEGVFDLPLKDTTVGIRISGYTTDLTFYRLMFEFFRDNFTVYSDLLKALAAFTSVYDDAYKTALETYSLGFMTQSQFNDMIVDLDQFLDIHLWDVTSRLSTGLMKELATFTLAASVVKEFVFCKAEFRPSAIYEWLDSQINMYDAVSLITFTIMGFDRLNQDVADGKCRAPNSFDAMCSEEFFEVKASVHYAEDGWSPTQLYYHDGVINHDGVGYHAHPNRNHWLHDILSASIYDDALGQWFTPGDPLDPLIQVLYPP